MYEMSPYQRAFFMAWENLDIVFLKRCAIL